MSEQSTDERITTQWSRMNEELIYGGIGPAGTQSPRSYTRAEIAAGRRLRAALRGVRRCLT